MSKPDEHHNRSKKQASLRLEVALHALRLFEEHGFDNTSVEQIAEACGISRRTLFRQFGTKEGIIFADHEMLLQRIQTILESHEEDPWQAVIRSARTVFKHFYLQLEFSQQRYRVVRTVPRLREREIVMAYRYERLYSEFLRTRLPISEHLRAVMFCGSIISLHNYLLRNMLRDGGKTGPNALNYGLIAIAQTFDIGPESAHINSDAEQLNHHFLEMKNRIAMLEYFTNKILEQHQDIALDPTEVESRQDELHDKGTQE